MDIWLEGWKAVLVQHGDEGNEFLFASQSTEQRCTSTAIQITDEEILSMMDDIEEPESKKRRVNMGAEEKRKDDENAKV